MPAHPGRHDHPTQVDRDLAKARKWYTISRQRGDPDAAEALEHLGAQAR